MDVATLLRNNNGTVVAPAGCGKTQLIVEVLQAPTVKPYLVLTHTTAGVSALQARLKELKVPPKQYHLATIAGWAMKLVSHFPIMSNIDASTLSAPNYTAIQIAASNLCAQGHINDILAASYSRVFVDEYQDCSVSQHEIITALSAVLPTIVFGDPMQAIFGFGDDPLADWNNVVLQDFPLIGELTFPWRWHNVGSHSLGQWILQAREIMLQGGSLDLTCCIPEVTWHALSGNHRNDQAAQLQHQYNVRNQNPPEHTLLVMGDSRRAGSRHDFAMLSNGVGVVEPVALQDVVYSFTRFHHTQGLERVKELIELVSKIMTGVNKAQLLKRVDTIAAGRSRTAPTPVEHFAVQQITNDTPENMLSLIGALENANTTRVYRSALLSVVKMSLQICIQDPNTAYIDAALSVREKRRHATNRRVPHKAIGSTLLLKGLEADHVIILDGSPEVMDPKNLYVALSRGARTVSVFSRTPIIGSLP